MSKKEMEKLADDLLRAEGFTPTGRKIGEVPFAQRRFEGRLIPTPMGGKPRPARPQDPTESSTTISQAA